MKCPVCNKSKITKLDTGGFQKSLTGISTSASAGATLASFIPIPALSTTVGAVIGGACGALSIGMQKKYQCKNCDSKF